MPLVTRPLEKQNLSELAYEVLKQALLSGRFQPGERLVLREVAAKFGISLTPVRDAVNRLIAERVLDRGPGGQKGGASVPLLNADEFQQLSAMRIDLESRLAFSAASKIDGNRIRELESILAQMAQSVQGEHQSRYLDLHRRFHFTLYDAAQMPLIRDTTETLWLRCGPALNAVLADYVPNLKRDDHHLATVQALREDNPEKVLRCIRDDIQEASVYIHQHLLVLQAG